jgi:hypothetical protein
MLRIRESLPFEYKVMLGVIPPVVVIWCGGTYQWHCGIAIISPLILLRRLK